MGGLVSIQQGEGPSRGLLCDCTTSPINCLQHYSYSNSASCPQSDKLHPFSEVPHLKHLNLSHNVISHIDRWVSLSQSQLIKLVRIVINAAF